MQAKKQTKPKFGMIGIDESVIKIVREYCESTGRSIKWVTEQALINYMEQNK